MHHKFEIFVFNSLKITSLIHELLQYNSQIQAIAWLGYYNVLQYYGITEYV